MSIQRFETGPRMSQVVVHGNTVYLAGVVAHKAAGESVTKQTQDILATIDSHLAKAGTDKSKLLSANIYITDMVISPAEVSVKVGDTIEWVNKDVLAHTATAKNGDFDVMMPPKQTAIYVLKKAGAVDYYCRFHPNMKATLKIDEP